MHAPYPYPSLSSGTLYYCTKKWNYINIYIMIYVSNFEMGRPPELKYRIPKTINFEYAEITEFEKLVGKDNVSKEIRAFIKKFVEQEKKGEASLDPLNLARLQYQAFLESTDGINSTLDIYLLPKKEIIDYIDKIEDIKILAEIEEKAHVFKTVARTRKLELLPLEKFRNENK